MLRVLLASPVVLVVLALLAPVAHAAETLAGTGYALQVPHGFRALPKNDSGG